MSVSLEGFAQQNAARPPQHLVKELVQNGLDALPASGGTLSLSLEKNPSGGVFVSCEDSGLGVQDLENMRTVFWTSKKDSRFKRGRMGRGFKEMLCLCEKCEVSSGDHRAVFYKDSGGIRRFRVETTAPRHGTLVRMLMPWDYAGMMSAIPAYFRNFLLPENVAFSVCGKAIPPCRPSHKIEASLPTEEFLAGRWTRPQSRSTIELVKCGPGEAQVFEMGIPVCSLEWDAPYHANVLQRVPMNPNRDAVMTGYQAKVHKACLATILPEMSAESVRSSWVGEAAAASSDEKLQKEVLQRAFGENLARSVPDFGKFSHDADAQESAGATILDTRQLTGGFRELAREHVPTSSELAKNAAQNKKLSAIRSGVTSAEASRRYQSLTARYGQNRVGVVCDFHRWLADRMLAIIFPEEKLRCRVRVADFGGTAEATWTDRFQTLTLALDLPRIWEDPTNQDNFALLVHETAHELAAHHGRSFASAVEATAGAACRVIFENSPEMIRWASVLR